MPKETFFNLPEDKRNKILDSARDEFTEHLFNKARVSNIIKNAGIPRGSFYQYFEDLEDLFFFLIEELFDSIYETGSKYVKETNDLFEFSILTFDYDYDQFVHDKRHRFMMNIMKSVSQYDDQVQIINNKRLTYINGILDQLDLSNIKYESRDDLIKMYHFIQDTKRVAIGKSLMGKLTPEEAKEEFIWFMDILKHGLLKEE